MTQPTRLYDANGITLFESPDATERRFALIHSGEGIYYYTKRVNAIEALRLRLVRLQDELLGKAADIQNDIEELTS